MPVPVDKALTMIQAGHSKALEMDIAVSVAVVDEGGRLVAFGRMDRARPMSVDIAVNKAYTSATFQVPTTQLQAQSGQSWFQSLIVSTQGKIMAAGGGRWRGIAGVGRPQHHRRRGSQRRDGRARPGMRPGGAGSLLTAMDQWPG